MGETDPSQVMPSKNLLVCFDAFGTLFTPREPIMKQYADVARSYGLLGFTDEAVGSAFLKAYKHESKTNPNFGHSTNLGAEKWWRNVITSTFKQVMPVSQNVPDQLVTKLLYRFWSHEGYILYDDVPDILCRLRQHAQQAKQKIVVGVITNSDDRVPDILESFGLSTAPQRYGQPRAAVDGNPDFDFAVMSYDVGHEKPDRRIFDAAVQTCDVVTADESSSASWTKIYVGDEYAKDVVGSLNAGWNAVLIDREGTQPTDGVHQPEASVTLFEAFQKSRALGFDSLQAMADRIPV